MCFGVMMGGMSFAMVLSVFALLLVISAGVYFGWRALKGGGSEPARALLDRRLASGEISPEDYFERDSALRT